MCFPYSDVYTRLRDLAVPFTGVSQHLEGAYPIFFWMLINSPEVAVARKGP